MDNSLLTSAETYSRMTVNGGKSLYMAAFAKTTVYIAAREGEST